jgi:hypothetical protein
MKALVALSISGVVASGVALAGPVNAGCQGGWTPWGGSFTCDGGLTRDGAFQRCVTSGAMGFSGINCYVLNVNDLQGQVPWVGP